MDEKTEIEQIIIQKRINEAMAEEFDKLLKENKDDKLLQLIIENKIQDIDLDELKMMLSEEDTQ
ncbi:MAG: hypothetical protein ACTSPV_15035 [Candidatus Hodarchaeales archaeon]